MIVSALANCYDRLTEQPDPDTGLPLVPTYGFTQEKISYALVISKEGLLIDITPLFNQNGKKKTAKPLIVPAAFKRTGKYTEKSFEDGKDNAFFLWDKTAYALGIDTPEKNENTLWKASELLFRSFKRFHTTHLANATDEGLQALSKFLEHWDIEKADHFITNSEIVGTNVVFQLEGDNCFLHERPAAIELWSTLHSNSGSNTARCLVTGESSAISRIHPAIKGVYGGQTSGGSIVSFNADSFKSYGKEQGENAPISDKITFKYTTALNFLLDRNNRHCFTIGDASTVFWASTKSTEQSAQCEHLFMQIMSPTDDSEAAQLRPFVDKIAKGVPLAEIDPKLDPKTRFYLLGLAPNASRISIRYWLNTNFGELAQRIGDHYSDLALEPLPWEKPPSIYQLLIQLAPNRVGQAPKMDDVPVNLAGELTRSILTGNRYPRSLLSQLLLRIRCDGNIKPLRVSLIKAVLQRDFRKQLTKESLPMSLDEDNSNNAYQLGRLFAALERIQSAAISSANATVTDRYFASASTTPYSIFPRLLANGKNHLSKIRKSKQGYAIILEKNISEIISKLPSEFPKYFSLEDQGRFTIGYYQQRSDYFTSQKDKELLTDISKDTDFS